MIRLLLVFHVAAQPRQERLGLATMEQLRNGPSGEVSSGQRGEFLFSALLFYIKLFSEVVSLSLTQRGGCDVHAT